MTNKINILKHFFLITAVFFTSAVSFAYEPIDKDSAANHSAAVSQEEKEHKAEGFDAGKMIMEHVSDNHQWHMFGHYAIPLPVILKTDKGIETFSSARFGHEGEEKVQGKYYTYALEGNKIVAVDELTGTEDVAATENITDLSITKNVASMLITMLLMLWIFISVANSYTKKSGKSSKRITVIR